MMKHNKAPECPKVVRKIDSDNLVPPKIHLVAIGNELLNGETRDTNLSWLIKLFTRKGGEIARASMIQDDFEEIRWEIEHAKEKSADLVVTTGGLGPTDDDATLAAMSDCFGVELKLNKTALGMVRERINELAKYRPGLPTRINKERKTMAIFPDGGYPLFNPVGVAPGMMFLEDGVTYIVLPGVPSEMKGIVKETLKDFWKDFFRGVCYVRKNIVLKGIPEAELAPYIRRANKIDPGVYIKSRLKVTGRIKKMEKGVKPRKLPWMIILHFSVIECNRADGLSRIENLSAALLGELESKYRYPLLIDRKPGRV